MPDEIPPIKTPTVEEFDEGTWNQLGMLEDGGDKQREYTSRLLLQLPPRALITFAIRCAKRVEPLYYQTHVVFVTSELDCVRPQQYASWTFNTSEYSTLENRIARAAAIAAATARAFGAVAAISVYSNIKAEQVKWAMTVLIQVLAAAEQAGNSRVVDYAAMDDLKLLLEFVGARPREVSTLLWNDPRLGSLWPDGAPEWYQKAEVARQALEEAKRTLLTLPDPNQPPLEPQVIARLHTRDKLDQMFREGKLAEYMGEYVIFANGQIYGHGTTLVEARKDATAKHPEAVPQQLVDYYVPGE